MEMASGSDQSAEEPANRLQALATGALATIAKLSGSSRAIPSDKDFHFYNNFKEFKDPVKEIADKSEAMLKNIGSSRLLWRNPLVLPDDPDEVYEWMVNIQDEIFERFDVSMDEFQRLRKKDEENGREIGFGESEGGFQMVYGKKKKEIVRNSAKNNGSISNSSTVKVVSRDAKTMAPRSRVPFHIPTIPRPQDEFRIPVDNSQNPFEHVWLQKSEDGSRFMHPLEKLSELDFVDGNIGEVEPIEPPSIESTPFMFLEGVNQLKELAAKLRVVNEFAVDLEHNQYRSFQGLTCLMQISTRTEDFVVDTLKLRDHIGPYLRDAFSDPSKKKVMHGADRDILWLQRDFGIYVCNLFDTGQASRVLQLERNSLEYLLRHFCGVTANKEYQNADWRLRPLPEEMLKYAREDTHYLLHIYDLMRCRLLSMATDSGNGDTLLLEVYKRSYDICMQLYEKELLTDTSYLHIYGLQTADFDSKQLAIVSGLCGWRDLVARAMDESTGYVLPNKALLEIARQMPLTAGKLRRLVKSRHPFVEHSLDSVLDIIKFSVENAAAFETASEQLRKGHTQSALKENMGSVMFDHETQPASDDPMSDTVNTLKAENDQEIFSETVISNSPLLVGMTSEPENGQVVDQPLTGTVVASGFLQEHSQPSSSSPQREHSFGVSSNVEEINKGSLHLSKGVNVASVQMLKKPSRAFGALLGKSAYKGKLEINSKVHSFEQDNAKNKLEQIKSSVSLPFHSFSGKEQSKPTSDESMKHLEEIHPETIREPTKELNENSQLEDIIPLENETDDPQLSSEVVTDDGLKHRSWFPRCSENTANISLEMGSSSTDTGSTPISLSDLSSSFEKCLQSVNQMRNAKRESQQYSQLKPFDYAAARKQMMFGDGVGRSEDNDRSSLLDSGKARKSSLRRVPSEGEREFPQARRSQAFPASGNRSATFR